MNVDYMDKARIIARLLLHNESYDGELLSKFPLLSFSHITCERMLLGVINAVSNQVRISFSGIFTSLAVSATLSA